MAVPKKITEFDSADLDELVPGDWVLTELNSDNTPRAGTIAQVGRAMDSDARKPAVAVYRDATGNLASATPHTLAFDGMLADLTNADMWDVGSATQVLIPIGTEDMLYHLHVVSAPPGDLLNGELYKLELYVNGVFINQAFCDTSEGRLTFSTIRKLAVSDVIVLKYTHMGAGNRECPSYQLWCVPLLER